MSFPSFVAPRIFPVTPSDTLPLRDPQDTSAVLQGCALINKGTAGNVKFVDSAGFDRTYPIAAGEMVGGLVTKVYATGTDVGVTLWAFSRR